MKCISKGGDTIGTWIITIRITQQHLCMLISELVAGVILTVIGLPLALLFGFLPWLLKIAGVVLLIKGLLDQPFRWENLLPAVGAFLLAALIGWIF